MKKFEHYYNTHEGETIIVCGCGESLNQLKDPEKYITIGVNDVGRLFDPTYLVVLNPKSQFSSDRFQYVENSRAQAIFSQLDLRLNDKNVVRFKLGKRGGTDISDRQSLPYTQNSPYVALCLAAYMGANRIGLIGVDFTDNHFFGKTGRHSLINQLATIDKEYAALNEAFLKEGVEVVNLSAQSCLKAFNKGKIVGGDRDLNPDNKAEQYPGNSPKIFFVHYKFLSCGDVFTTGLRNAAMDLSIQYDDACWDDPGLEKKVRAFSPDLLFVVHGRKFIQKWGNRFRDLNSAVWLVDEPYEVDDTSRFSVNFNTVFVNDPATIHRHKNAHYLPVCFDPQIYFPTSEDKKYDAGFIGGYNSVRQSLLESLHREGLLSYVVGGPWKGGNLNSLCLSGNVPASETARLYQQSRIVINIFREVHHFNRQKIEAISLNPRVYEAIACGAVVVSEYRQEIKDIFPEMPVFETGDQLIEITRELIGDSARYEAVQKNCYKRLKGHTYLDRLKKIISVSCREEWTSRKLKNAFEINSKGVEINMPTNGNKNKVVNDWHEYGALLERKRNNIIAIKKERDNKPGSERGLASQRAYGGVDLSFEVKIKEGTSFIVKIHQEDQLNQLTNSYHLFCEDGRGYFARHDHIFETLNIRENVWEKLRIVYNDELVSLYKNGRQVFSFKDHLLKKGYSFIGVKGGEVQLRNIVIADTEELSIKSNDRSDGERKTKEVKSDEPRVSIITTVYDRVECLKNCIESVKNLNFKDYEHIIVSDCPPKRIVNQIKNLIKSEQDGKLSFYNLNKRHNNWGIAPAEEGLKRSKGEYLCFLSDDNGYLPDHFDHLLPLLDKDENLGFVYSSCKYNGSSLLERSVPRFGQIDLGQPLFRRSLFDKYLWGKLPFNLLAWDWQMIEAFLKKGVKYKHSNKATFLFRLEKYRPAKTISFGLIHPSRGRPEKAKKTYLSWLEEAEKNNRIRHYLSLDESDSTLLRYKKVFNGSANILINRNDCVVQATNAAAMTSTEDVLIYLSDDFQCPQAWDSLLEKEMMKRRLDPSKDKFVFKVDDALQDFNAPILTIPIMSRALYSQLQYFWHPEYKSMFVDKDLFDVCNRMRVIINVPELMFEHKHYSNGKSEIDETYKRSNEFWNHGELLYKQRKECNFGILQT